MFQLKRNNKEIIAHLREVNTGLHYPGSEVPKPNPAAPILKSHPQYERAKRSSLSLLCLLGFFVGEPLIQGRFSSDCNRTLKSYDSSSEIALRYESFESAVSTQSPKELVKAFVMTTSSGKNIIL